MLTRYVGAAVCARLADEGARVAILLLALERTGRAGLGGLLVATLMVPHVLAAPIAGALADRARRRKPLYLAVFVAYALGLAAAAVLIGRSTPAAVVVLFVAGCFAPLLIGGLTSLLGDLAGDRRDRAFALDVTSYSIAGIAGPALAAVVAGLAGAAWALAGLGALVVLGGLLLATLPLAERTGSRPAFRPGTLVAALRVMTERRSLGAVTAGSVWNQIGMGALPLVAAALAAGAHRPAVTGLILSAGAAGGLLGSLLCARFPFGRFRPERVLLVFLAATVVPLLVAATLPVGWPIFVVFALLGGLGAPVAVALFAVRDREAPAANRTQVFTLGGGLKVTGAAAGAAVAGLLAGHGATLLLLGIAACQIAGALTVLVLLPRGPRHPAEPEFAEYR